MLLSESRAGLSRKEGELGRGAERPSAAGKGRSGDSPPGNGSGGRRIRVPAAAVASGRGRRESPRSHSTNGSSRLSGPWLRPPAVPARPRPSRPAGPAPGLNCAAAPRPPTALQALAAVLRHCLGSALPSRALRLRTASARSLVFSQRPGEPGPSPNRVAAPTASASRASRSLVSYCLPIVVCTFLCPLVIFLLFFPFLSFIQGLAM